MEIFHSNISHISNGVGVCHNMTAFERHWISRYTEMAAITNYLESKYSTEIYIWPAFFRILWFSRACELHLYLGELFRQESAINCFIPNSVINICEPISLETHFQANIFNFSFEPTFKLQKWHSHVQRTWDAQNIFFEYV